MLRDSKHFFNHVLLPIVVRAVLHVRTRNTSYYGITVNAWKSQFYPVTFYRRRDYRVGGRELVLKVGARSRQVV